MISLIIPTFNRPHFLGRLLRYYRELNFPHMIVVADASFAPACQANQNVVASLRDVLNIGYELWRPDIHPYSKIAQALEMVNSKYAVICGDDDFIVPRAIEQCVCFLEANPDYSVAHGRAATIVPQSGAYGDSHHGLRTYTYRQRTIDFDDPRLRLQNHLVEYAPTFYSVHRRPDLIRNMQFACKNTIDYRFGELLPSCLSLIQGKARCLDILYLVRQSNPDSTSKKTISWPALLTSDDFSQRLAQFHNCLAEELAGVTGMPITEAKDAVNSAFLPYLARLRRSKAPGPSPSPFEQTVQRVWRVIQILPAAAGSALLDRQLVAMARSPREAYRQLHRERARAARQDDMSIDKLLDPQAPFHADFLPIYEHVGRYPNGVMFSSQEGRQTSDAGY